MSSDVVALSIGAAVLAVGFHISIIPQEIDFQLKRLFVLYVSVISCLFYLLHCLNTPNAALKTVFAASIFNVSLALSIFVHRAFLHRTKGFPGPFWAKVSRFYAVYLTLKKLQHHKEVEKLHKKFGDYVRTGPREISIIQPAAVQAIYGSQSLCTKAGFYSQATDHPNGSLNSTRVKSYHNQRRKAWDKGFSIAALKEYEPEVQRLTDLLISQLCARAGTVVDAVEWSNFYAFDVMGAVGFGKSWGMLESGEMHEAISQLHSAMVPLGVLGPVPWLLRLATDLPGANKAVQNFMDWCWNQLSEKKKNLDYESKPKDVMTWILTDSMKLPDTAVNEDSRLMIIAGSDTTAAALANALYFLLTNPRVYKKLQSILDEIFPGGDADFNYSQASAIPFLDGIIHETLRLKPSVPAGLTRITPVEGLTIDDVYIPGDVVVSVPVHTIQRDERYYENALEFIPERWTVEKAEMVKDKRAYAPFSLGTYGCVGKNLAMMELRMAIARIALSFDVAFAEGETGRKLDEETKDTFTLTIPSMFVTLTERRT